nr:MAG TPA: hypothetical protein [Bacteriophage sp.]
MFFNLLRSTRFLARRNTQAADGNIRLPWRLPRKTFFLRKSMSGP